MTTPPKKPRTPHDTMSPLAQSVKDSAQQIWQAGLGAFNKAQAEGSKAFDVLVKEGAVLQRKTQTVAEEKLHAASQKVTAMASEISTKASGQWDKLEGVFEDRVAKALHKMGVPAAQELTTLMARVDELQAQVRALEAEVRKAKAKAKPKTSAKSAAVKVSKATKAAPKRPAAAKKTPSRTRAAGAAGRAKSA